MVSGGGGYKLHPFAKPEADMSVNDPATCRYKLGTFGFVKLAITSHTAHVVRHQSMHPLL